MNYLVADLIIRLKNAVMARRRTVELPYSKLNKAVTDVLVKKHILVSVKVEEKEGKKTLIAEIAFDKRFASFSDVEVISKPSLRVYARGNDEAGLMGKGLGFTVVSTSHGVMTGKDAFKKGVGGEVLFKIW